MLQVIPMLSVYISFVLLVGYMDWWVMFCASVMLLVEMSAIPSKTHTYVCTHALTHKYACSHVCTHACTAHPKMYQVRVQSE